MEEETEKTKDKRGLRWSWEKLAQAKGEEEVQAILAEAAAIMGDEGDLTIKVSIRPKSYLKLVGDAYLAVPPGEIEKPGSKELLDRALAVYSNIYRRLLMKSRRGKTR